MLRILRQNKACWTQEVQFTPHPGYPLAQYSSSEVFIRHDVSPHLCVRFGTTLSDTGI
jgi:hypothetical protein